VRSTLLGAGLNGFGLFGFSFVSLIYRASPRTPYRISWGGVALIGIYLGALVIVYWQG